MSLLDGILGSLGGGGGITGMIEQQVAGAVAAKMGIDPAMAQMAINALTQAHPQPGDTVATAAQQTGLSTDILSQITGHLGGEGGLGQLVGAMAGGGQAPQQQADAGGGIGGVLSGVLGGLMGGGKS